MPIVLADTVPVVLIVRLEAVPLAVPVTVDKEIGVPEPDAAEPEYKPLSSEEYVKMFGLKPRPKQ